MCVLRSLGRGESTGGYLAKETTDGLAKEKLLKCKRSLHSYNPILSSRLTQLWDVGRSLLFQLFAIISIMNCHLWICRCNSYFLLIYIVSLQFKRWDKTDKSIPKETAINQLHTTVLVSANPQEDMNNKKNVWIIREISEIFSLR